MAATIEMLNEAQTAYHRLLTGSAVAEIKDQNGEMVRYNNTNRGALATYIEDLKRELGLLADGAGLGPMRVWF